MRDFTYIDDIVEGVIRVMQGNVGKSSGFDFFGVSYGSSTGKHYLFDDFWY